jgi:hypothetical protein
MFTTVVSLSLWTQPLNASAPANENELGEQTILRAVSSPYMEKDLALNSVLKELSDCESSGRVKLKILDTNNRYSYSKFQFQAKTFLSYGKKYGIISDKVSEEEIENYIYDESLQNKIAGKMIENGLLEANWVNCYRKMSEGAKEKYKFLLSN